MEGLTISGEVQSCRKADDYNGQPGGYWLMIEDGAGRQYSVKSYQEHPEGEQVQLPVRPRAKKNGEGFWYTDASRPVAQLRAAAT